MYRVEDEDAPCRSQAEGAMRGWLLIVVTGYKVSGSTETGVRFAGALRPILGRLDDVNPHVDQRKPKHHG